MDVYVSVTFLFVCMRIRNLGEQDRNDRFVLCSFVRGQVRRICGKLPSCRQITERTVAILPRVINSRMSRELQVLENELTLKAQEGR
jgi:hypothetical protein